MYSFHLSMSTRKHCTVLPVMKPPAVRYIRAGAQADEYLNIKSPVLTPNGYFKSKADRIAALIKIKKCNSFNDHYRHVMHPRLLKLADKINHDYSDILDVLYGDDGYVYGGGNKSTVLPTIDEADDNDAETVIIEPDIHDNNASNSYGSCDNDGDTCDDKPSPNVAEDLALSSSSSEDGLVIDVKPTENSDRELFTPPPNIVQRTVVAAKLPSLRVKRMGHNMFKCSALPSYSEHMAKHHGTQEATTSGHHPAEADVNHTSHANAAMSSKRAAEDEILDTEKIKKLESAPPPAKRRLNFEDVPMLSRCVMPAMTIHQFIVDGIVDKEGLHNHLKQCGCASCHTKVHKKMIASLINSTQKCVCVSCQRFWYHMTIYEAKFMRLPIG